MGGVAKAVGGAISAAAAPITAPIKAISGIASGGNVAQNVTGAAVGPVSGTLKSIGAGGKLPVVGQIGNALTANGFTNSTQVGNDLQNGAAGGSFGPSSDYVNFGKSAAIVGSAIATGGAAAGANLSAEGVIGSGLAGAKLAGGLLSGNPGAIDQAVGFVTGNPTLGDIAGGAAGAFTTGSGIPDNGTLVPSSFGAPYTPTPAASHSPDIILPIAIAALGLLILKKGKRHG